MKLREASYKEAYKTTVGLKAMGGVNYKVYVGVTSDGLKFKVIVGQDAREDGRKKSWHMSISSMGPIDDETCNQIVGRCWPQNVHYVADARRNYGLHFIHLYEAATPRQ